MRSRAPFQADDLAEMDERLFSQATQVIAMQEVYDGNRDPNTIGLRHDCDAGHSLATAVCMAEWEADRSYRSTYFVLHTSPYWNYPEFRESLDRIAECGHEIGLHINCLAEALRTGQDPDVILDEALATLRGYGFPVRGVVGHGDPFCNRDAAPGEPWFANDEQLVGCRRTDYGAADRIITRGDKSLRIQPRPLSDFGLEYEGLWVSNPLPFRISDSGGKWVNPGWEETVERWTGERQAHPDVTWPTPTVRQLHLNAHPDWWAQAFSPVRAAA